MTMHAFFVTDNKHTIYKHKNTFKNLLNKTLKPDLSCHRTDDITLLETYHFTPNHHASLLVLVKLFKSHFHSSHFKLNNLKTIHA